MSISDAEKNVLEKILASDTFKERDLYKKLLSYLVEASSKGDTPKEVTIAIDVFNKGLDFNAAEDTTVRVHIHNLRKRLKQYYQSEGQMDEIKLFIPKGHYRVTFIKNVRPQPFSKNNPGKRFIGMLISILIILILYIVTDKMYLQKRNQCFEEISRNDAIWGGFFDNGYPNSVVIGDFLVFHEYSEPLERSRRIQDYEINLINELDQYIKQNPDKNVENWFLGELPHNSIFNIVDIQQVFLSFKQKFNINFTTEIDINFIKNRNIIYIGEFKNLRALSDLVAPLPVTYQTLPWWHGVISFKKNDSLVTLKTSHDWSVSRYVVDLALVAKLPGQSNENYLIIAGIGYNSQIKIVEIFSHKSLLIQLAEEIKSINGEVPEYFVTVFEVSGFDRASTKAELQFFQEIRPE